MSDAPGRSCPLHYRHRPGELARADEIEAEVAWVAGGLYGNPEALAAIRRAVAAERARGRRTALVFNGDFHWFDADPGDFAPLQDAVLAEHAIAGNVELELAQPDPGAGCGCAYPDFVDDVTVARSNRIIERLRDTAEAVPRARERLATLPRLLRLRVGDTVTGVIHGDPESVAGWQFAIEHVTDPQRPLPPEQVAAWAADGRVDAFACSHTCLPWAARLDDIVVINNGSAGMPNFRGDPRILVTRIAGAGHAHPQALYAIEDHGVRWEAVAVEYDSEAWWRRFLSTWPDGSPAHASYADRILHGPAFEPPAATPVVPGAGARV